jgi:uncharacterized protein (TIGR03067 family)
MLLWVMAGAVVVGAPKAAPAGDPRALVGEWVAVTSAHDGAERTVPEGAYVLVFAADGKMTEVRGPAGPRGEGTYKADPKADPPAIDFVRPPDQKKPALRGIYKVDGDTLTVCLPIDPEGERPKAFEAPAKAKVLLLTFKRAKKD